MASREELLKRAQLLQQARMVQKQKAAPAAEEKSSLPSLEEAGNMANAAAQGFGQGASMGYLPQLQAMAEPVFSKVGDAVMGTNTYDDMPSYETRRDQWLKKQLDLQKQNPASYMGGQLVGGISSALAVPQATLAKTAGLGTKIAASLASGAGIRALQNPGDVQGEFSPMQLGERFDDAFKAQVPIPYTNMSVPAMAIDAVAPTLGPLMNKGGEALKSVADTKAFKALGPYTREARQAFSKGKIGEIGREVLDSGAISWMPKSYENLQKKLSSLKNTSGQKLGDTVERMAQEETGTPIGVSRTKIADEMAIDPKIINTEATDAAGALDRNAKMQSYIDSFRSGGEDNIPLLQAEMKKTRHRARY